MRPSEILDMFAAISNIDSRVPAAPSREIAYAWAEVLDDVDLEVAKEAVRDYYRSEQYKKTHDRITTGDIVDYARRKHADERAQRRREMELETNRVAREGRAAIEAAEGKPIRGWADRFAIEDARRRAARSGEDPEAAAKHTARLRDSWRAVACPYCEAPVGQRCVVPGTDRVLRRAPAHPKRMEVAQQQVSA